MKKRKYGIAVAGFATTLLAAPVFAGSFNITQLTAVDSTNNVNVGFGFWENGFHDEALRKFGRRPIGRLGINSWQSMENKKANDCGTFNGYDANSPGKFVTLFNQNYNTVSDLKSAHQHGESVIVALNMGFMSSIVGQKGGTIPTGSAGCNYADDITNLQTQQQAQYFIKSFVQYLMGQIGSFSLAIDYETDSNFKLDSDDGSNSKSNCGIPVGQTGSWDQIRYCKAKNWGVWYGQLALAVRQAAADYNKTLPQGSAAVTVTLTPILNGDIANPTTDISPAGTSPTGGIANNQWIVDTINNSDVLGVDDYHCDTVPKDKATVRSPAWLFNALGYWEQYLGKANAGKTMVVTENGFAADLPDQGPQNQLCSTANNSGKYKGSFDDMVAYYSNMFVAINGSVPPSSSYFASHFPHLRAFSFWELVNNPTATDTEDRYFGAMQSDPAPSSTQAVSYTVEGDRYSTDGKTDITSNLQGYIKTAETAYPPFNTGTAQKITYPAKVPFTDGLNYSYVTYRPAGGGFGSGVSCNVSYAGTYTTSSINTPLIPYVLIHSYAGSPGSGDQWDALPVTFNNGVGTFSTAICANATAMDLYFTADQLPLTLNLTGLSVSIVPQPGAR